MGKARERDGDADKPMRQRVKDIVARLGRDANAAGVIEVLKQQKADFSESTVKQYVSFARVELGFSQPRGGARRGGDRANSEPTVTDLLAARQLCDDLKMNPRQLVDLASRLSQFGDVANLSRCLEALERLSGK